MESEKHIQNAILAHYGRDTRMRLWRANAGVARPLGSDQVVRFGLPGQADLTGILAHTGRRLEIEVKSAVGRQTKQQRRFQDMIHSFGGLYILARSVDDVEAALMQAGHEHG